MAFDSAQRCLNALNLLIMLVHVEETVEKMIKVSLWQMAKANVLTAVFELRVCDLGSHPVHLHNSAH